MIIGFDVSKYEIVGVLIDKRASVRETYIIKNEKEIIEEFLAKVLLKHPKVTVGSEATGEYHNVLAQRCIKKDIPFYLLNPIVTKQFTKATVRKKKTDLTDAHVIAKCILQGEGYRVSLASFSSQKPVLRTASSLSQITVAVSHMERRFKEHIPQEDFVREELHTLYEDIQERVKHIRLYAQEQTDDNLQALLCSIPGIGVSLAPILIAEIGDISRFKDAKALIAYAGLDPKVRQSGYTLNRNTRLTKRGSPYLRRAAYIASSIAQRHDAELKEYYDKKRGEGKRYKEATIANARHILYRVYAVWRRGTPYVPRFLPLSTESILTEDSRSRTCFV